MYPPAAPGWHEAHQPPVVIQGETVPAAPTAQVPATHAAPRAKRPVALLAAVALAAAVVGGGTAAAVQQLMGSHDAAGGRGVNGTNVSQSSNGTVAGVAEQVSPSVVRIDTRTGSGQGTGSGIVVTADGEVVTNNHVVSGATEIQVTMSDGKKYKAKIVGTDPGKDLALIKLEGAGGTSQAEGPGEVSGPPSSATPAA